MKQKTMGTVSRFWSWARDETASEQRVLRLEGVIAEESWLDDDVTPAAFKAELMAGTGPITVWVNSPGGDVRPDRALLEVA